MVTADLPGFLPSGRWHAAVTISARLTAGPSRAGATPVAHEWSLRFGRGGDEVIAEPDERGLGFDCPRGEQDLLAALRVSPFLAQRPAGAVPPVDGDATEPGV